MPLKVYFTRQSLRLTPVTGRERQIDEVDEYPNLIDHIRRDHIAFKVLLCLSGNGVRAT
jgi:hypothetical protein